MKAEWRGDFRLDKSASRIAGVDNRLEIRIEEDDESEEVLFEKTGREFATIYRLDGDRQPIDDETRARIDEITLQFLRASAVKVGERVKTLSKAGGPGAVIDELDYLTGDTAVRQYVVTLSEYKKLSPEELTALAEKLDRISGDHDLALALETVAETQELTDEAAVELITAAGAIESDYDKRRLVAVFAKGPLADPAADVALDVFRTIDGDYDMRVAAEALLANEALNDAQAARLLSLAAARIDSDHDMRLVLEEAAPRVKGSTLAEPWLAAFAEIDSDYDKRVAMEELTKDSAISDELRARLIDAASGIDSEYERELALKAIDAE